MKKLLLPILFLLSCGTTQQASCPPSSIITKDSIVYLPPIIKDSTRIHDSSVVRYIDSLRIRDSIVTETHVVDSFITHFVGVVPISPLLATQMVIAEGDTDYVNQNSLTGDLWISTNHADNWVRLQGAINYSLDHPPTHIHLYGGEFQYSKPLIVARIVNGQYQQVSVDIEGAWSAKNGIAAYLSFLEPTYDNGPAIALQVCKGCHIGKVAFVGRYTLPRFLNVVQIDTLDWTEWNDGVHSMGRTDAYTAIAIDPFSDSTDWQGQVYPIKMYNGLHNWYPSGARRSGSTDINIVECGFQDFVAGVIVSEGFQQNGDLINVIDCGFQEVAACIANTQAQSKENHAIRTKAWGQINTIFDGVHFGFWHGDGVTMPMIDGVNIAGYVYQFIQASAYTFPIPMANVYGEGLFMGGSLGGNAGVLITGFQVDYQTTHGSGLPSPEFWWDAPGTTWIGNMGRTYDQTGRPIVMNSENNYFLGGSFSVPPITYPYSTPIVNTMNYYPGTATNGHGLDSVYQVDHSNIVHMSPGFIGWFTTSTPDSFKINNLLLTYMNNTSGDIPYFLSPKANDEYPVGYVYAKSADTIFIENSAKQIRDGMQISIFIPTKSNTR